MRALEENFEKLARITQLQNQLLQQQHSRQVEQAHNLRDVIQNMADNQRLLLEMQKLLLEMHKPLVEMHKLLLEMHEPMVEMHKLLVETHNWMASAERRKVWLRLGRRAKRSLLGWASRLRSAFVSPW